MCHALDLWGNSVYRVALSQTRSPQDAQDVAQDVFLRLLESDVTFAGDEHLKAWLLRVTINRCKELHRSWWKRRVETFGDTSRLEPAEVVGFHRTASPEDIALSDLQDDRIWKALRALPEHLQVAAVLFYVAECQTDDIARIVGCAPATVRTRLHRAREQMRRTLETKEEDHGQGRPETIPFTGKAGQSSR